MINIDKNTINFIYKIIFGELTFTDFNSLNKLQKLAFVETIFKSRAHFLILNFFDKHEALNKKSQTYKKAKEITNLSTLHSMIHYEESFRLNKILKKNDITLIFLKGIHLVNTYYDDFICRPIRDIDVLVDKGDIKKIIKILLDNGYHFENSVDEVSIDHFLEFSYDLPALISQSGARLEVHFSIEKPSKNHTCVFTKTFMQDSKNIDIGSHSLGTLSEEDLILHLIYHGFKKQGPDVGIIFISDIYRIICANNFDHFLLIKKAKSYKLLPHLKIVVSLLSSKSKKRVFQELNNKISYKADAKTLESIEYLFIRNDLFFEEIKVFKFFKQLGLKKILNHLNVAETRKEKEFKHNKSMSLFAYYILRVIRYFKILIILILRMIVFKSLRHQFLKMKNLLSYINDF